MTYVITSGDRALTLEGLRDHAARAASGFAELGVGEADSVAIMLRNDLPYLVAVEAAVLLGAYAVPVNWHFTGEEAGYILDDSDAKVLLVHADLLPRLDSHLPAGLTLLVAETPPEIRADFAIPETMAHVPDGFVEWERWLAAFPAWNRPSALSRGSMIYTSGTTGRPKGVRREPAPPELYQSMVRLGVQGFGLRPGMNAVMTGPLYHSAPMGYARTALGLGCNLHLTARFDAERLLQLIETRRLSHIHVVPTMFHRLLALPEAVRQRYDVSSLEHVIHGAAPCPPHIKQRMIDWWGPVINEYYGSTEAGLVTIASSQDWLARPGTVGRPQPGTTVKILDDAGKALGPGVEGEIYMSIECLSDFTYHKRDDERRAIGRDGLITNGDVGYLDEDGYLFLSDRKRDMVISGGVNIYPAEIEAVLSTLPGVEDCAVFGVPDEAFGEAVAAAIAPEPDADLTEDAVKAYLREHLADYKVPKLVAFHASLPREDSGKLFKRKLREPYWQDAGRRI